MTGHVGRVRERFPAPPTGHRLCRRPAIHSRSLIMVMGTGFLLSLAGADPSPGAYNSRQLSQYEGPVSWWGYVLSSDFWSRTLQNWQSEFLAVAPMAVFAIHPRQRGSPESKPVGAPYDSTGVEG